MISIYADDELIYSPVKRELAVMSPILKREVNKIDNLSFKIFPNHPFFHKIEVMSTRIRIKNDDKVVFRGRVYSEHMDFNRTKTVYVESEIGFLNDVLMPAFNHSLTGYSGLTFKKALAKILKHYNLLVPEDRAIYTTDEDKTSGTNIASLFMKEPMPMWSGILSSFVGQGGAKIINKSTDEKNIIDLVMEFEQGEIMPVKFAVNLMDLEIETDASELVTAVCYYGNYIDNNTTINRYTGTSVPVNYIYDENSEMYKKYGLIAELKKIETSDPADAKTQAQEYFDSEVANRKVTTSIKVKALDTKLPYDEILLLNPGDSVSVQSEPHNVDMTLNIVSMHIDILKPSNTRIELGGTQDYIGSVESIRRQLDNIETS